MVRIQVIPDTNSIAVNIPDEYIGKKVDLILFSEDDVQRNSNKKGEIKKYKGLLSAERTSELQNFALRIRQEWDREL